MSTQVYQDTVGTIETLDFPSSRNYRRLTESEKYKLYKWLHDHLIRLREEGVTYDEIRTRIFTDIGVDVHNNLLYYARKFGINVTVRPRKSNTPRVNNSVPHVTQCNTCGMKYRKRLKKLNNLVGTLKQECASLHDRLNANADAVYALVTSITHLYDQLGEKPPDKVEHLLKGRAIT